MPQSRRSFLRRAAALSTPLVVPGLAGAAEKKPVSETLVKTLYESLSPEQRKQLCFPFDHPLRRKVDNNWHITKSTLEDLTGDQQAMVKEIFMGLHSREYAWQVFEQVEWDSGIDGFESSSIALFGSPGTGKFEFVLTGRHCTRRCDGDSVEGTAFGGPIFYGHAAKSFNEGPAHEGNVYWFQAVRANEVFQMLDGKQRRQALCKKGRREQGTRTVALTGKKEGLDGIRVADLSPDQKGHVRKVMADLLAPFREVDRRESMKLVEAAGFDHLHLAFYQNQDIGNDRVWDVWQIEGPSMLWYFRGSPHVHTWVHIKDQA
ncbi:MAG: DUF3500 domain-containing protein [Akkermansiaceae bacterium]|nr:DUF3500 domain-containing protein [Akkermansiaceae bacterium]